ncbi:MAG: response regulator transcription factor [Arcobacteraceae bacterium]|jgi:two-component system OmpR family response regulator|nr:response regulator transcription factor [Arcobacteraceae bacterium]
MLKILLIEDDLEFAELISNFLVSRSIHTDIYDDPFKALVINLNDYDLVLLDLGLPGIDGLEIAKEFRKKSKIPIIISSARNSTTDKVLGLQIGADDYLPKPYDPDELYARIVSLIRRVKNFQEEDEKQKRVFEIDVNVRDIKYLGNNLFLTEAEFEVCEALVKNQGSVVSKEQLLYGSPSIQSSDGKSLEMIISKIRQKIKPFSDANHIISLRGRGYRIVE